MSLPFLCMPNFVFGPLSHLTLIIFEQGPHSDFDGPTCGSTACVALVRNNQLVVANAGDSRCVISRAGQVCILVPAISHIISHKDMSDSHCLFCVTSMTGIQFVQRPQARACS